MFWQPYRCTTPGGKLLDGSGAGGTAALESGVVLPASLAIVSMCISPLSSIVAMPDCVSSVTEGWQK